MNKKKTVLLAQSEMHITSISFRLYAFVQWMLYQQIFFCFKSNSLFGENKYKMNESLLQITLWCLVQWFNKKKKNFKKQNADQDHYNELEVDCVAYTLNFWKNLNEKKKIVRTWTSVRMLLLVKIFHLK